MSAWLFVLLIASCQAHADAISDELAKWESGNPLDRVQSRAQAEQFVQQINQDRDLQNLLGRWGKNPGAEAELKDVSRRLKPEQGKLDGDIPFNGGYKAHCADGSGRVVSFEPKPGETVFWGRKGHFFSNGVSLQSNTPHGPQTTRIPPHEVYPPCMVSGALLQAVAEVACAKGVEADVVIVNAAYRDPIDNYMENGVGGSQHLRCQAIDFALARNRGGANERIDPRLVQRAAAGAAGVVGLGLGNSFTHVDVRSGPRAVWRYGKNGKPAKK